MRRTTENPLSGGEKGERYQEMMERLELRKNREVLDGLRIKAMLKNVLQDKWQGGEIREVVRKLGTDPVLTLEYQWEGLFGLPEGEGEGVSIEPCQMFLSVRANMEPYGSHHVAIRGGYRLGDRKKQGGRRQIRTTIERKSDVYPGKSGDVPGSYENVREDIKDYFGQDCEKKREAGLIPIPNSRVIQEGLKAVAEAEFNK